MTMITPSYLGETIEYSSLHACRSTLEDPTRPNEAREVSAGRPAAAAAISGAVAEVARYLAEEERDERERDREYWTPLKRELEQLRRGRV